MTGAMVAVIVAVAVVAVAAMVCVAACARSSQVTRAEERRTSVDEHADQAWRLIADAAAPTDWELWESEVGQ